MNYSTLNFILFQAGWFACVLGAAYDRSWIGPGSALLILGIHLNSISRRREIKLIASTAALGTVLDSILAAIGICAYMGAPLPWLAPPWITSLWVIFASTFRHCLGWLSRRYVLCAVLGFIGSPLSFAAAERLGAIHFPGARTFSLMVLAIAWALAMPGLIWLSDRAFRRGSAASERRWDAADRWKEDA